MTWFRTGFLQSRIADSRQGFLEASVRGVPRTKNREETTAQCEGARMATTTKKDLIDRIADETQQRRVDVKRTVQAFLDQVIDELGRGNRLEFRDFGVFEIKDRAPRVAQNPKTLERVDVPARRTVKFKVGRLMRETLGDGTTTESTPLETSVPATTFGG